MLRSATIILAILVLGSSSLSASAFAHGGYGGGGGAIGSCGNNFGGGFGGISGHGYDGHANRASGLRGEFRGCGSREVWGHWGAYYGPMIPMI